MELLLMNPDCSDWTGTQQIAELGSLYGSGAGLALWLV